MAELITVRSTLADNKVAMWERHPDHPNGEVLVKGGRDYRVAHTSEVDRRLKHGGLKRVDDAPAEEPEEDTEGDTLPADFPARDALIAGGYSTLDAVRAASDEDLDKVSGIGPATIEDIREAQ